MSFKRSNCRLSLLVVCLSGSCFISQAQEAAPPVAPATPPPTVGAKTTPDDKSQDADKSKDAGKPLSADQVIKESMKGNGGNVLGVLPNFRTTNIDQPIVPLKPKDKFTIAYKDSFYPTIFLVTAAFAGLGQLENLHPQFGQGMEGYAKRYATGYADQALGNIMTEGLFPVMLHQDPRYFRRGSGSIMSRTGWAVSQIFVTRTDSGRRVFNASEIVGNGTAAAISLSYYVDNRNIHNYLQQWYTAVGTDLVSDILKEFWPDIKSRIVRPKPAPNLAAPASAKVSP